MIKNSFHLFFIFLVIIFICLPFSEAKALSNQTSFQANSNQINLKINDYVEYSIDSSIGYWKFDQNGSIIGSGPVISEKSSFFRWTVVNIVNNNITLKIEVSVGDLFSESKQINLSNRVAYDEHNNQLGYLPFSIPLDFLQKDSSANISLEGSVTNPLLGSIKSTNYDEFFLGGARNAIKITNPNNYSLSYFRTQNSIGQYIYIYSPYNGIMLEAFGMPPLFWRTLGFSYVFSSTISISKSNIDFGPIDKVKTLIYTIAPFGEFIILFSIVIITLIIIKYKKAVAETLNKLNGKFFKND